MGLSINVELHSDVAEAPIGPRSVVATSPDKLEECKWELEADTENFITTIEVHILSSIHINTQSLTSHRKLFTLMPGVNTTF